MKKTSLLILALLFVFTNSFSQTIELTPSIGISNYFKTSYDELFRNPNTFTSTGQFDAKYTKQFEKFGMSFGLSYIIYKGKFNYGSNSPAGGTHYTGSFNNSAVNLSLHLIKPLFNNKLELFYGANVNFRVSSNLDGKFSYESKNSKGKTVIALKSEDYGRKILPTIGVGLAYPISVSESIAIVPTFYTRISIINEYNSLRNWSSFIGVGIRKNLSAK